MGPSIHDAVDSYKERQDHDQEAEKTSCLVGT